jgi:formylglycine-generating enzyme required for sulfatase activity/FKBP-type peptidyl-prolyl cis-trans isomerase/ribosomal protein L37E
MNCLRCGQQLQGATCSHCGYAIKEGDAVVSLFALNIDAMNAELKARKAVCRSCGKELQEEWKVCPYCGTVKKMATDFQQTVTTQTAATTPQATTSPAPAPAKKHTARNVLIAAGVVVVIASIVIVATILRRNSQTTQTNDGLFGSNVKADPAAKTQREDDLALIAKQWPNAQINPAGVRYIINTEGQGEKPKQGQMVSLHYRGYFLDGTVFDDSRARGKPIKIPAGTGTVILPWDQMVLDMQKGEKRTVIIPPELGYGAAGVGDGAIPPNAFLVFEIELIEMDDFVKVDGGTFQMGSPNEENSEKPVHSVTVSNFYMGKYEVTQKEWVEIMGNNPSHFKGDNLPVETVSWNEAVEYCNKRSVKEGLSPAYRNGGSGITCDFSASGYRLPTEAEWEYAAKGGNKDLTAYEYSGGNNVDAVGWYSENSRDRTHPVGTKAPNSLGLYDMSGNVYEWCWDWKGDYSNGAQTNPAGAASGSYRVLRGGSWISYAQGLRSAYRLSSTPSLRSRDIGFRLVRP